MTRESNTIRRKDDRDNGILWVLILFVLVFELVIGLLTYLTGPLLVVNKSNSGMAAVGITIQDVDTANTEIEQTPEEPKRVETIVYEKPEKQIPQVVVQEVKLDEPVQPVVLDTVASTTSVIATSSPVIVPEQVAKPIDTYTLSYVAGDGGHLIGSTTQVVVRGGKSTEVTAVPNNGYNFYSWSDGSVVSTRAYTVLTENTNFTANFVPVPIRKGSSSSLSSIATITSGTYTVSAGGTANETITGVSFGTDKSTFLSALTKGQDNQSWNDTGVADTVASGNTLIVTAQDGTTIVTYTVTVNDPPPPGGPG